ncbi:phage virion morphogenesis protein [Aeromonas veronii]|nr:phage virion morphogenesis protein [Aeromonas veronii]
MFAKLVKPAWFKATATATEAAVEFKGSANRLATVHHFGLRDKINGKEVQYPERQLIGITDADIDRVEDALLKHLTT